MWKLFLFLLSTTLLAEDLQEGSRPFFTSDGSFPLVDINGEPSAIVAGCINVITGDYVEMSQDLVMPGSTPLTIDRSYSSSDKSRGYLSDG